MVYFDMDGLLAKYIPGGEYTKKGYFLNLEEDPVMVAVIVELQRQDVDVAILSQYLENGYALQEKKKWLESHNIHCKQIFVPYGSNKDLYINGSGPHVLIDDYTKNLKAWESAGYVAIKYYNGINGTHKTWKGRSIYHNQEPDDIIKVIKEVLQDVKTEEIHKGRNSFVQEVRLE